MSDQPDCPKVYGMPERGFTYDELRLLVQQKNDRIAKLKETLNGIAGCMACPVCARNASAALEETE